MMRRTTTLLKNMESLAETMSARGAPYLAFVASVVVDNTATIYRMHEESEDAFEANYLGGMVLAVDDVVLVVDVGRQPIIIGAVVQPETTPPTARVLAINFVIDGGGSELTIGDQGDLIVEGSYEILEWTIAADQSGSADLDIWKSDYGSYPPTVSDSITGSAPPTLSGAEKATSSVLTGWDTSLSPGDILRYHVDAATTVERLTLELRVIET